LPGGLEDRFVAFLVPDGHVQFVHPPGVTGADHPDVVPAAEHEGVHHAWIHVGAVPRAHGGERPGVIAVDRDDVVGADVLGGAETRQDRDGVGNEVAGIHGIRHTVTHCWQPDDGTVIVEFETTYIRLDDTKVTLNAGAVFRLRVGKIADYRVYADVTPVFAA